MVSRAGHRRNLPFESRVSRETVNGGESIRNALLCLFAFIALPIVSQPAQQSRPIRRASADVVEGYVKRAAEQFETEKKLFERDLEIVRHLRSADDALADTMQPSAAIQKAFEHVEAAEALGGEFVVKQGVVRVRQELAMVRRSPGSADFGRLRALLRDEALRPASRVAARNALRLEEDILSWIKLQERISQHLRVLSELTGESLRMAE